MQKIVFMKKITLIFLLFIVISSCSSDPHAGLKELDLMQYGMPISIYAPEGADVKTMDFGVQKDVTVQKGKDFYVEIFSSEATTTNVDDVKNAQLKALKENPFFSKVIQDDKDGFIYENQVDSTKFNYGFRHVKIQGDKEFIFQTGLIGFFTKEAVEKMYAAVK